MRCLRNSIVAKFPLRRPNLGFFLPNHDFFPFCFFATSFCDANLGEYIVRVQNATNTAKDFYSPGYHVQGHFLKALE